MRKKIIISFASLLVSFCLAACGTQGADAERPTDRQPASETAEATKPSGEQNRTAAVQAGDIVFYADEIQRDLDALLKDYDILGSSLSEEERKEAAQSIMDEYVIRTLTKARLKELGIAEPDENTLYEMRAEAQTNYDEYWKQLRESEASEGLTDSELTEYLAENGITLDYFFETLRTQYELQLLMEHYDIKTEVSEADIDSYYEENYIKPCRERYENNITLFEEEVVYGDYNTAYTPEGFKIFHQIVIPVPEDIQEKLTAAENEAKAAAAEAEEAYNKIADLAIQGKDTAAQTEIYQKAMNRIDELDVEYGKLWQSVLEATKDECDEIYARMMTGEPFDDLMMFYDHENIIVYHPQSELWPSEMKEGAATLKKKGDISQPVLCSDGVHILYYYDDIPSGETKLEDEDVREQIRQIIVQQRTLDALKKLTDPWAEEFGLKTDFSALQY